MAITFSCGHCGKSLTTTDDKAGRKAKCPGCGEILSVPASENEPLDDAEDQDEGLDALPAAPRVRKPSSSGDAGTKTCPMCGEKNKRRATTCEFCGETLDDDDDGGRRESSTFEAGEVISATWSIYKRELGIVLGSVIIAWITSSMASLPANAIDMMKTMQQQQGKDPGPMLDLLQILLVIPAQLFGIFLQIGVTKVLFKVARGKEATIGEIFSGGRYFLRMLGSSIVFGLMLVAGLIACVVPGIIVLLMFWPFVYVLVDEEPDGIQCLWRAKEITQGNWGSAFVLALAAMGINLLGLMACCVGIIFTAPLTQLMFAVAYCRMTSQRTAE